MVFFGEYQVAFSAPGRIVLPKRIRELLKGDVLILSKGYSACLAGYDKEAWEARASSLLTTSLLSQEDLEKKRFLFSSTVYLEIDEQGRFVIPKSLLEYAKLNGKATIVGVGDHFEVWSVAEWEKYIKEFKQF
jgi:MraZ protein